MSLNQNLTCKYNASDDYFYVLLNGVWKKSLKAFAQALAVWANGQFGVTVENGTMKPTSSTTVSPFTISGNTITSGAFSSMTVGTCRTLVTELIDFTNYSTVKLVSNSGTYTINVSALNQSAYLAIDIYHQSASSNWVRAFVSTTQNLYTTNQISGMGSSVDVGTSVSQWDITEIILE